MKTLQRHWREAKLAAMTMPGVCIDLGCGKNHYAHGYKELVRVDWNPEMEPNMIMDLEKPLAFPDNYADTIMLLDVAEHVYNYRQLFLECYRILKKGGTFIFAVPMLMAEHRAPMLHDYNRFTNEQIHFTLAMSGFSDWAIDAFTPGPLSAAVNLVAQELHWEWLFRLLLTMVSPFDWAWRRWRKWGSSWMVYAIEYMVVAIK